jgi:hypothetical protein
MVLLHPKRKCICADRVQIVTKTKATKTSASAHKRSMHSGSKRKIKTSQELYSSSKISAWLAIANMELN